ncbi:MAG: N-formylglutamate deformylase [Gammaproteobacteria bacterium]|nr:N-formylglutamate deformylase [Gammaproteobacteria bacterium]
MTAPPAFEIHPGNSPIVLAIPHTGDHIPAEILTRLTDIGHQRNDTDWHIHRLYDGLLPDATVIRALFHRYVIDPNRDPAGGALYANRKESSLCPLYTFDGQPLYLENLEPDNEEVVQRTHRYHRPYHAAIEQALQRALQSHGIAILYDCHSVRSVIPTLFNGKLPDLNIGTVDGSSCSPQLEEVVYRLCDRCPDYSVVLNGVFRGGWTTRHHGQPDAGIHAIQMELSQSIYMLEQPPWTMDNLRSQNLRSLLKKVLHELEQAAHTLATRPTYVK